ncbi:hypothetical protein BUALT_Bualt13G0033400 [Buddleja alternifolia]|uniref:Chlorophyllase n=1 Tax=Buddleja alternifolia TaxID=168488 RepID=A0AAV6WJL0_9LAMI|nr:hypothetical protein BUALT_Bualt13G0033400 [Buddleja alternifolia]
MAALKTKRIASESSDVLKTGKYEITTITVKTSYASKPPTELFILAPVTKGTYPVMLFCHDFMLPNTCYKDLLKHIASHGYIVVAPKFYGHMPISIPEAVQKAARVTEWLYSIRQYQKCFSILERTRI